MCRRTALESDKDASAQRERDDKYDVRSVVTINSDADRASSICSVGSVESRFAGLSLAAYTLANAAALASISETHDEYDVIKLCDFITEHYPEVPARARPYLAIGVAAGAQHA